MPDEQTTVAEPTNAPTESAAAPEVPPEAESAVKDADIFAGNIKGALEVNGAQPEEDDDDDEGAETGDNEASGTSLEDDAETGEEEETSEDAEEQTDKGEEDQSTSELTAERDDSGIYDYPTVENPGEFTPGDYGFQIALGDGKTYNVKTPDDAEAIADLLDEKPELISAKQFIEFNRKVSQMDAGIANDKAYWEEQTKAFEQQTENQMVLANQYTTWQKEFDYLSERGDIPALAKEDVDANWSDPSIAKRSGVKERIDIMKWMETENQKRERAGLAQMTSFLDAYRSMQFENLSKTNVKTNKREKASRRAKGALVGSTAPYSQTNVQKGEIVGEGGSLNDLM